jgi:hypothetical protein
MRHIAAVMQRMMWREQGICSYTRAVSSTVTLAGTVSAATWCDNQPGVCCTGVVRTTSRQP